MSRKSPVMHTAITGSTCSLRMPWRSTNAFWAPMAAISDIPVRKPRKRTVTTTTLG
ncbi:Uncharacterised protein [Mycobacteroides abscessus subsp. abscessus]|nr:Uncharacterised protein [Mycobacteroides abscessus subsp. abscessus]